jgi:hypothetical protein
MFVEKYSSQAVEEMLEPFAATFVGCGSENARRKLQIAIDVGVTP